MIRTLRFPVRPVRPVLAALAALLVVLGVSGSARAQPADFEEVLVAIDANTRFPGDLSGTITLETRDPDEGDELQTLQFFRRDEDDAFLMLTQAPEVRLGQGYLNLDDGLWFYDPESRQFSYTSLDEAFAGSDARNSDVTVSTLAEDYDVVSARDGTLGSFEVWILELEASHDEVTYPYRTLWVAKQPSLILKSEDYSLTRRLLRTAYFPSYVRAGDSFVADEQIFVDALVEDKSTRIAVANLSTAEIPDTVFTKAYVERVNR